MSRAFRLVSGRLERFAGELQMPHPDYMVAEDQAAVLDDERVAGLFHGLDFARVDDSAGSSKALVQEIWRMFLQAMMVAMVCEAALCLPKPRPAVQASRLPRSSFAGETRAPQPFSRKEGGSFVNTR